MSETVFTPDRMAYWRSHAWLAVIAMVGAMGILWFMGNPHVWTGAIGGHPVQVHVQNFNRY